MTALTLSTPVRRQWAEVLRSPGEDLVTVAVQLFQVVLLVDFVELPRHASQCGFADGSPGPIS